MKVFSKSYDHKIRRRGDRNGYRKKSNREKINGRSSVDKVYDPRNDIRVKSNKVFQPLQAKKSSNRIKKSNKIFLSHREYLKNKKFDGQTRSSKGFFSKSKTGINEKRKKEQKGDDRALPGLSSFVTQVPEGKKLFLFFFR